MTQAMTLVTLTLAGRLCGIDAGDIRDVLRTQAVAPIPLAPPEVAGSLNLRGRIVTAIDLRRKLGLAAGERGTAPLSLVTERDGDLYALQADAVGEVLTLSRDAMAPNPPNLADCWARFSNGVHALDGGLLVVLDVGRLLAVAPPAAAR